MVKKILVVLVIIVIAMSMFTSMQIESNAATMPINKADLYSKGEVVFFNYDNVGIGVEVIVYKKDGVEYPAYCINKGRPGVTEEHEYSVSINKLVTNNKIWKAIVNGYPFKTPQELGCNTEIEAFTATKLAIYDMLYDYDMSKFNICANNGQIVLNAMRQIREKARNSNESKKIATIKIIAETENWQIDNLDKNCISKTYRVDASAANEEYTISIANNNIAKVVDESNVEKTTFKSKEKFKIMLPIKQLEEAGEIIINAKSNVKTYPILYGKSTVENKQNYVLTVGEFETSTTTLKERYMENTTKIKVIKKDGDTKNSLSGSKFKLLDENEKIIYTELITDEKGIIEIKNLVPGKYHLKEVQAPSGYLPYEKEIDISLKLNETVEITVENFKEPEDEEKEVPEETSKLEVGERNEIKKLPRTGF